MMETDEIYTPISIKKSYEELKEDLLNVLSYNDEPLICGKVREYWKNFLDVALEPVGWTALWKMSREVCSKLAVPYPTTAIVKVQNIDFKNFLANVNVLSVEEDICIPECVSDVPLIQLFPTFEQSYEVIDIYKTANIIHDLRVFFTYLWYPWDEKLNENEDWLSSHFEDRLKLHYDILSGMIDSKIKVIIETLIEEGKYIYKRILEVEEFVDIESREKVFVDREEEEGTESDLRLLSLYELNLELNHISEKLNFYQKKYIRNLLERKQQLKTPVDGRNIISLAWSSGSPAELICFINEINKYVESSDNMRFECSDSLDKLLSEWKVQSQSKKLFLKKGNYCLNSRSFLSVDKGIIQGLDDCEKIIISDSEEDFCLLYITSEELKISNLLLKTDKVKYALLVRSGRCYLKNVKITCDNKTKMGIFVASGAELTAENCHFCNSSTAIFANKDSSVTLTNCKFENNVNGLEFQEGGHISLDSCQFNNNRGIALLMEDSDLNSSNIKRGKYVLEDFQGVKIIDTTFNGNHTDMAKYS